MFLLTYSSSSFFHQLNFKISCELSEKDRGRRHYTKFSCMVRCSTQLLSMEFGSSFGRCFKAAKPHLLISTSSKNTNIITLSSRNQRVSFRVSAVSYKEFAESALEETRKRVLLEPSPLQVVYSVGRIVSFIVFFARLLEML